MAKTLYIPLTLQLSRILKPWLVNMPLALHFESVGATLFVTIGHLHKTCGRNRLVVNYEANEIQGLLFNCEF